MTGRRVLFHHEFNRLILAENIKNAYQSRARAKNWAEWTASNPNAAALLMEVEGLQEQPNGE